MDVWSVVDGEPFLINPPLGIVNPKRKRKTRGKNTMARRRDRLGRFVKSSSRRRSTSRRRKRRNAYPVGGVVRSPNPRRRRRTNAYRSVARRRSRRARNPRVLGLTLPPLTKVAFGLAGFIAPPAVEGALSRFLPVGIQSNSVGKYLIKGASVAGLTIATRKIASREASNAILFGGLMYVGMSLITDFAPQLLTFGHSAPAPAVEASNGMNAYRSLASKRRRARLGAYAPMSGYGGSDLYRLEAYSK